MTTTKQEKNDKVSNMSMSKKLQDEKEQGGTYGLSTR
jgi:hypothetical protein